MIVSMAWPRHYDASSLVGPAVLGEMGWYDVAVQKISVGDQEFTGFGCAPRPGKACVMATGLHVESRYAVMRQHL